MGIRKKGKFITFEGIEGSGKSTQIKLLKNYIEKKLKKKVFLTREPGGTSISEKIRKLIINDLKDNHNPYAELYLIFAARALHFDVIKKKIDKGYFVLCDRYIDSTIAYQHYNGSIDLNLIKIIQSKIHSNKLPNITFLLDINPQISKQRLLKRGKKLDRFDKLSLKRMRLVRNGFLKLAKIDKKRVVIVKNDINKEVAHNLIIKNLLKKI